MLKLRKQVNKCLWLNSKLWEMSQEFSPLWEGKSLKSWLNPPSSLPKPLMFMVCQLLKPSQHHRHMLSSLCSTKHLLRVSRPSKPNLLW